MCRPGDQFVGPPIVPGALWQVDVAMLTAGVVHRSCQQRWPQQHLVVEWVGGRVVREVIEQRPQYGSPAPRRLPEQCVEVGEQPVAQSQELAANSLNARAEDPRLVALGADRRGAP